MEGDAPVEIELTPTSTRAPRFRRPGRAAPDQPDPTAIEPADEASGPRWTDEFSRRAVITIACVGVGALIVGWVLGRASGDAPDQAAGATETTTPSADTEPTIPGETLPAVVPDPRAATTSPRRTTTTIVLVESETIEVDPALVGAPYEFVGLDRSGNLVRLDPVDETLQTRRDLGIVVTGAPARIWAGEGWAIVPDWNAGSMIRVDDGADPVRLDIGPPWQLVESDAPGEFWTFGERLQLGVTATARRFDRHGDPIGEPIELDQPPRFADPTGGLVVDAAGGSYRVDADGATKIVDGSVLAMDERRVLAYTCDDQLECDYVIVDRTTGDTRAVPIDSSVRFHAYSSSSDTTRIAPDGHTAAVTWFTDDGGQHLGLIDIDTGALSTLSDDSDGMVRWSPDARFAFHLESDGSGVLMAHEIATGESFVVAESLPRLNAFAVRPPTES